MIVVAKDDVLRGPALRLAKQDLGQLEDVQPEFWRSKRKPAEKVHS